MDYKQKYLKYKNKYLQLKGGWNCSGDAKSGVNHMIDSTEFIRCPVCLERNVNRKCISCCHLLCDICFNRIGGIGARCAECRRQITGIFNLEGNEWVNRAAEQAAQHAALQAAQQAAQQAALQAAHQAVPQQTQEQQNLMRQWMQSRRQTPTYKLVSRVNGQPHPDSQYSGFSEPGDFENITDDYKAHLLSNDIAPKILWRGRPPQWWIDGITEGPLNESFVISPNL